MPASENAHAPFLDNLRSDAESYMTEILREEYLVLAGLKTTPEWDAVVSRYAGMFTRDTVRHVFRCFVEGVPGSDHQRRTRLLLDWLVVCVGIRATGPIYEKLMSLQARAVVTLPGGATIPYQRAVTRIAKTIDAPERRRLDDERAHIIEQELAPLLRDQFQRERAQIEELGLASGYVATWELVKGISLRQVHDDAQAFLNATRTMWEAVRVELVRSRLDMDPMTATRADAMALFRADEFDDCFAADVLESHLVAQVESMGMDPTAAGRIIRDTAVRDRKAPRAFCAPVRVPDEVYLVTCPAGGGAADWSHFLHEMAHALHFANTNASLPIEYRRFGDLSVTETYASLFDHLLHDQEWLERHTALGSRAKEFVRLQAIEELYQVRRYCARLGYEIELYSGDVSREDLPGRYVERMSLETGFQHRRADAFVDVDPRFNVVNYLRARQLRSTLSDVVVGRFGRHWWSSRDTGQWMISELFAPGSRETADEISERLVGKRLSFDPLRQSLESRL